MSETQEPTLVDEPRLSQYNVRRIGFAAGVIAAAAMLVAIAVLRLLSGATSLPEVVAQGLLTNMPGALFSAVLDALQHSAKPLFYVAVGVGMLLVGGFLGQWYAPRPTWQQAVKIILGVWLVFGLGVYTLLGAGIFGQYLEAGPVWHGLSLLIVLGVYGVALWDAYAILAHRAMPALPEMSRRAFLREAIEAEEVPEVDSPLDNESQAGQVVSPGRRQPHRFPWPLLGHRRPLPLRTLRHLI